MLIDVSVFYKIMTLLQSLSFYLPTFPILQCEHFYATNVTPLRGQNDSLHY